MVFWTSVGAIAFPSSGTGGTAVSELFYFFSYRKSYKNHESPVPVDQKGTSASIGTSTAKPK